MQKFFCRHFPKSLKGQSLLEVLASVLITGIVAMGVFTMTLSMKQSSGKGDRSLMMEESLNAVSQQLNEYMGDSTAGCFGSSPPSYCPNAPGVVSSWCLPDDTKCSGPTKWAFTQGVTHTITGSLPSWLQTTYLAISTYSITQPLGVNGIYQANMSVTWTEP